MNQRIEVVKLLGKCHFEDQGGGGGGPEIMSDDKSQ
jgi:hypothetical protein